MNVHSCNTSNNNNNKKNDHQQIPLSGSSVAAVENTNGLSRNNVSMNSILVQQKTVLGSFLWSVAPILNLTALCLSKGELIRTARSQFSLLISVWFVLLSFLLFSTADCHPCDMLLEVRNCSSGLSLIAAGL